MGTIIDFKKYRAKDVKARNRMEAMAKGEIEIYTCDRCGEEIEVINNDFPQKCPTCNVIIVSWNAE